MLPPMSVVSVTLPEQDVERLAELARREGATPEAVAASAVKARLDADAAARREIEAGLAELDAGRALSLEDYEREMDAFMADLSKQRA
jgi:predicted transcriptional regulator